MAETVKRAARAPHPSTEPGNHRAFGFSIAAFIFILDQATKWVVTNIFQLRQRGTIELLPIFDLKWVENRGVSMGFLTAGSELERWLLVALTIGLSVLVTVWLWRENRRDDVLALSLVLGGALGNILDRVRFGYVVDFADLHFGDIHPFLVFNVSDAAITIGILLLLVRALLTRDGKAPREEV
ncbi:signal peptidase II [Sphingosinicella rhizophila]|uniref:Lipoprotein signal peptidase n=1 Tax=Sphingosinicella rhizophila TaxID=3050082 RepID=A0ABU3Q6M6_9SPHN|nr:signal peptidase II [Sphingosinicella sp. GR2756]MDT9599062.1 signal peptidase II [Sphingosinicella sp. GR2756]